MIKFVYFHTYKLSIVCDIIRSQDVPIGIRQTLIPVTTTDQEQHHCFQHSRGRHNDQYMLMDEDGKFCFCNQMK